MFACGCVCVRFVMCVCFVCDVLCHVVWCVFVCVCVCVCLVLMCLCVSFVIKGVMVYGLCVVLLLVFVIVCCCC